MYLCLHQMFAITISSVFLFSSVETMDMPFQHQQVNNTVEMELVRDCYFCMKTLERQMDYFTVRIAIKHQGAQSGVTPS